MLYPDPLSWIHLDPVLAWRVYVETTCVGYKRKSSLFFFLYTYCCVKCERLFSTAPFKSALVWCQGNPHYWARRQQDTVFVGNAALRIGLDTGYGGTAFQLYRGANNWNKNLLLEHGGGAAQLSIWGYDEQGPPAWFRLPPSEASAPLPCDPTPFVDLLTCQADGHTCVERCCSRGRHVLDCVERRPCQGWTAGAPLNPIQAQGAQCFWDEHSPTSLAWLDNNTTLFTVQQQAYHFTSNTSAISLAMSQWTSVNPRGFANITYKLNYTGLFPLGKICFLKVTY